jgi:hypothetical protein
MEVPVRRANLSEGGRLVIGPTRESTSDERQTIGSTSMWKDFRAGRTAAILPIPRGRAVSAPPDFPARVLRARVLDTGRTLKFIAVRPHRKGPRQRKGIRGARFRRAIEGRWGRP